MPEHSFADDVSGRITEIAVQIAAYLFEAGNADKKIAYEQLLRSFPAAMHVRVLADAARVATVEAWLSGLALSCRCTVEAVAAAGVSSTTTWLRDAFLRGQRDGTPIYAKCRASKPGADQADWLSASDGTPVVEITDVFLEGGDCLVGPDFWLVGKSAVKRSAEITGHLCDEATALARIAALDCRPLCVVGYRNVETRTVSPAPLHDLAQGWAHIDLVVSLTGRKPRGTKGSLMIAETQLSPKPDRYEIAERDRLNALAQHLRECGFNVIRNPSPYDKSLFQTLWYNNTIVQTDPDIVWLPQFADHGRFADTDEANRKIWRGLGFDVVPVAGWLAFERSEGSIRCATSVIARQSRS